MSSKVYNVLQGLRQGGVLSMSLYQVYIADLLTRLKSSGTYHDGHYYGSLCFADDLVLIALFTKTLCKMLDIAADYANMWRYSFNVKKSAILAYTKSKVNLDKIADICCVDEVTHVGIPLGEHSWLCVDLEVILNSLWWQYILNSTYVLQG